MVTCTGGMQARVKWAAPKWAALLVVIFVLGGGEPAAQLIPGGRSGRHDNRDRQAGVAANTMSATPVTVRVEVEPHGRHGATNEATDVVANAGRTTLTLPPNRTSTAVTREVTGTIPLQTIRDPDAEEKTRLAPDKRCVHDPSGRAASDAVDADFTLEPASIVTTAGATAGTTILTVADDRVDVRSEALTLFAGVGFGSLACALRDASVRVLPMVAQLLLAAFLAIGGYRRYVRRLSGACSSWRCVLGAAAIAATGATASDVQAQSSQPATDQEVERGVGSFVASDDLPLPSPDHPPIDTIPPMPMPTRDRTERFLGPSGPDMSVSFDLATRRETRTPIGSEDEDPSQSSDFGLIPGYPGADGGIPDDEIEPVRFGDMSLISPSRRARSPWRRNAKLVMHFGSRRTVCSGTMIDPEVVLTAGHCVYDHDEDGLGPDEALGWADEVWVYPGWDGEARGELAEHYGVAVGTHFFSETGWTVRGSFEDDLAEIVLRRAVGTLTGWPAWEYTLGGGRCRAGLLSTTFGNASYPGWMDPSDPSDRCTGEPGRHTGTDMYYWTGQFDQCVDLDGDGTRGLLRIYNGGTGCLSTLWGGMSGSSAFYTRDGTDYAHAVASYSQQIDEVDINGNYARLTSDWRTLIHDDAVSAARGDTFDLQPLNVTAGSASVPAGGSVTVTHLAANPTNGSENGLFRYRIYLSENSNISPSDTLLSTWSYSRNFAAMTNSRRTAANVRIPPNTPPGDYFLGLIYDDGTDGVVSNNDTDGWDAARLRVTRARRPDLVVSEVSVDDDTLDAGQTTFLNYTIRNQGNSAITVSSASGVTAFRSEDATISWDGSDTSISSNPLRGRLGPGETISGRFLMPAAPSSGTWYYGACVRSVVGESSTANNCSRAVPVTVSGASEGCALDDLGTLSGTVAVSGTLDHDCVSPNWSGELARYYSFTLGSPASVEIDLVSSEFDAWLTLREGADVSGRGLVYDDNGGVGTNSRISTELSAGTYTIEATSFAAGETGAFTLTVTAAGGGGGGCALDDLGALSGRVTRVGNLGGDCESPNYSGRLARYYSFTLGQAGPVEIDLFSTAFDTFLTLREGTDAEGRLVVSDDDGGEGTNSRIATELSAGTYTIEATSYATGVTGAFTLTVAAAGGGGGGCALDDLGALSGTATRVGNLGDDCESPNYPGKLARYYSFTLGQAGPVEIDLVSSVFDAFLAVREGTDAAGRLVATDDDGGQGTNSRIGTELSAGTYTIEATSYATGVTGAFTLTVTAAGGGGGGGCALDDLGALSGTATRVGNLDHDCESPNYSGRLARYYSFTLGQAGPVEIDLVSSAFDTWLALREGTDVSGRLVVSDDDGGQGTNSRIDTALSAGTYTIEATSYATGVTGAFTLTVTAAGGGGGGCGLDDLGALSGTATRVGSLGNDCESPSYSGRLARYYSFTLGQAGSVEIDLVSSVFDTWLALREGTDVAGRLVVSDDDGGQGTNSRIDTELSAGTYTIEATSYAPGVTGVFTLTATAAGGGGGGCALDDLGGLSGTVTRLGNLGNDCESPNYSGRLARYYSFTLGQAGSVEIDLVSSAFDTSLALREGADVAGRLVVSDDDGGQGTNSRIGTALSAGTYTIEATSYAPGVTGAFTLTVTTVVAEPLRITSNGGGDRATITLPENQTQVTTVTASGGTPPYAFQWSSDAAAPDGLKFVMNTTTGSLAFRTPPDYENPTDSNGDNNYGVNVRVTDASAPRQRDSQVITVRITDVAERLDEDRAALEALYDATGGAGWVASTNWRTSAPLDEWYGVTADADDSVTGLELGFNGLTGPIPVELGGLVNLQRLDLFSNDLTGPIPSELGSLVNLETLDFGGNELTGSIPVNWAAW